MAWIDLLEGAGVETRGIEQDLLPRLFYVVLNNYGNMAPTEAPHIGHLIKDELAHQERTVVWLARKLNYSRQNIYHIFESQWITTDVLLKICDILDYNFYKVYADYWDSVKNNITQVTK